MNNRNSGASADLKDFEIKTLKNFEKSLGSGFALEESDRHFREIDGVFAAPGSSLVRTCCPKDVGITDGEKESILND